MIRAILIRGTLLAVIMTTAGLWPHLNPPTVAACSCVPLTPAQAFERADTVFVGEVTSFKTKSGLFGHSSIDPTTANFKVMEVWKGPRQGTLTIGTVRSEVSCGYEFQEGLRYLVYARDGQTGLCDRTALTIQATEDLAALGDGWKPEPSNETVRAPTAGPVPGTDSTSSGDSCGAMSHAGSGQFNAALLGVLAGAIALGIGRRRRL